LQQRHEVHYFGINPFLDFINIMDNCHIIITPVTMALHIAIGLNKHVCLLNNIFNKNEFYLYGKGRVVEPPVACLGCYKSDFDRGCPVEDCTALYDAREIVASVTQFSSEIEQAS
jgi:heptosyltransferase-2